jgi:hypothetical protein
MKTNAPRGCAFCRVEGRILYLFPIVFFVVVVIGFSP